ncbi:Uncharacterised protein [Chromobacterium violaceum]|uniref:Uncharacterized protein n=1 Tax=Chromobacterium violaceum TaxID=536 RepID=A0A447T766_CHRVL|nr:Uncharacterised protein [Chromobacterium violaceum]
MTRLAIVRQKYNPAGGAERFVSRALAALRDKGELEVSLIARRWEPVEGVKAYQVDGPYLGNVWRDWSFAGKPGGYGCGKGSILSSRMNAYRGAMFIGQEMAFIDVGCN